MKRQIDMWLFYFYLFTGICFLKLIDLLPFNTMLVGVTMLFSTIEEHSMDNNILLCRYSTAQVNAWGVTMNPSGVGVESVSTVPCFIFFQPLL